MNVKCMELLKKRKEPRIETDVSYTWIRKDLRTSKGGNMNWRARRSTTRGMRRWVCKLGLCPST